MQDLHAIAGGTMFGAAPVDRRLRQLGHHSANQALKCPRCDSLNTKFCYYNNYNLSQPRHFCKSCRRYWTKGGVLRNVPVGGGCRKNKRAKVKTSPPDAPGAAGDEIPITTQQQHQQLLRDRKSSSHSSSESSSLTAATTEAVSAPTSTASPAGLLNILEYNSLAGDSNTGAACFGRSLLEQGPESGAFADIGGLTGTGLIAASSSESIPCGFTFGGALLSQQGQGTCHQSQWQQQDQIPGAGAFLDQTVQVDLSALQGRFGPFDWQPNKESVVFDLPPNAVNQAYWSQSQIQWTDQDQPGLYLP